MRLSTFATAAVLTFSLAGAAFAATPNYAAALSWANEVAANISKGAGQPTAKLDTVTYSVSYSGLTGSATAAHFHGPAMAGANAEHFVPVPANVIGTNPILGDRNLDRRPIANLQAGRWYFSLHRAAHGGGETAAN